jgi:hypothetical protein
MSKEDLLLESKASSPKPQYVSILWKAQLHQKNMRPKPKQFGT